LVDLLLKQESVRHERKAITAKRINTLTSIYDLNTQAYKFNSRIMTSDFQNYTMVASKIAISQPTQFCSCLILSMMNNYFRACLFSGAGSLIAFGVIFAHHLAHSNHKEILSHTLYLQEISKCYNHQYTRHTGTLLFHWKP